MDIKPATLDDLFDAAMAGDFARVWQLANHVNLNSKLAGGEGLLVQFIWLSSISPIPSFQLDMLKLLLSSGADPDQIDEEGYGALMAALMQNNTAAMLVLLEHGANPNKLGSHASDEALYDWAEFHYRYHAYGELDLLNGGTTNPPDEPVPEDMASEDMWLAFLDRCAIRHNLARPIHLLHLRRYGAKSARELKK